MGWTNSHLHCFEIGRKEYAAKYPDLDDLEGQTDEETVRIGQVLKKKKKFAYIYDYGDGWEHNLVVEAVEKPESRQNYPVCLEGANSCPPEDCGGIWGYYNMLDAIDDPDHDDHETYLEWLGDDFDPDRFDLDNTNENLARIDEYLAIWDVED
jgi:hypothetical protein